MLPAAILVAFLFVLYALGACPTIYVGDSGDLVTAVDRLGLPHPTGYPLYVLLGKPWTLLVQFGSIAERMSLFSAACAALACGVLYTILRRVRVHPAAALFAALLLAFSPSFWSQANVQRVYSLGSLFVLLATWAAWRWYEDRSIPRLMLACFLCGLGATNHTSMAVYGVAFGLFAVATEPSLLRRPRQLAAAGAAFAFGLLPYAYLPLRALGDPPLAWGDPKTLDGFLDVVLRRDFWDRAWAESPLDLLPIAADYGWGLAVELAWVGLPLALIGLVVGRRRGWPILLPLLVMLGNLLALALHGSRSDVFIWHRYYHPSYAMLALLAGIGCHALIERLPRPLRLAPLAVPLFLLVTGWQSFDRSRYRIAEEFSLAVLDSMPPGANLSASDDNILFSLIYLTMVENHRPDVNLILQGIGGAELQNLRFDPDSDPLFFTHHPNWNLPELELVPVGLVFQTWRSGRPPPDPVLPLDRLPGADDPRVPKDYLTRNLIGHFHYMRGVTFERRDWIAARREFEAAAAAAPENDVLFYNLGLIYRRNGLLDDAIAAFERSQAINPRHIASSSRARASDRLEELTVERVRLAELEAELANDPVLQGLGPGTAAYHGLLGALLEHRDEPTAAYGHRLLSLELGAREQGAVSSQIADP